MRRAAAVLPPAVRTPLTMIIGSAGLLREFHQNFGPDEIELLAGGILEAALSIHQMAEATGGAVEVEGGTAAGTTVRVRWRDPGRRDPAHVRVHDSRA